jgi:Chalcone isomerase-like
MKLHTCALVFTILFQTHIQAQTVTAHASDKIFEDVKLSQSITVEDAGLKNELKSVSYGIRKKKVYLLAIVKIYVAEFFAADPAKLQKNSDGILASLKSAGPVQLRLTVSRDLTGTQISESFAEALKANDIDADKSSKELATVLSSVHEIKKFKTGEVFSLTATWKDGNATLLIQKPDQSVQKISGPEKFVSDLFSIWFGKPADDKLADLKKSLLK